MYDFKKAQEFGWFLFVAASTSVLQILVDFNPDKVQDWKLWAIGLGAGAVRAVAAATLAWIAKN